MSEKTREVIHHIEWFSIIATLIGGFFLMNSMFHNLDAKIERQSERTDKLYEMFIDLIKERK